MDIVRYVCCPLGPNVSIWVTDWTEAYAEVGVLPLQVNEPVLALQLLPGC